ncbi:MAG: tetratricopeptide repeat protein, partial [Thermodesulfobacteriota bacterium]|nr:tetratricopeptide repeat protein [Thermodesulfobacteriota bacterium]
YNNARRHHPRDENLMFNMARTQYEAGQMTDAIALLEKALEISPDFKEAGLLLTQLRSLGDKVELDKTL